MKIKKILMLAAIATAVASCSTNNSNSSAENTGDLEFTPYSGSITGDWEIKEIAMNDSLTICPAEISPDEAQMVMFTDSTYHFQTNCNLVQGDYSKDGDNISFTPGLSTRMACSDMSVEDALNQLLPRLSTVTIDNDSILCIIAENQTSYILLQKIQ